MGRFKDGQESLQVSRRVEGLGVDGVRDQGHRKCPSGTGSVFSSVSTSCSLVLFALRHPWFSHSLLTISGPRTKFVVMVVVLCCFIYLFIIILIYLLVR